MSFNIVVREKEVGDMIMWAQPNFKEMESLIELGDYKALGALHEKREEGREKVEFIGKIIAKMIFRAVDESKDLNINVTF